MNKSVSLRPSVRFTPKQQEPTHKWEEDFFFSPLLPTSTPKEPTEDRNDAYEECEEWQESLDDTQKQTTKQKQSRRQSIRKFRDDDAEEEDRSENKELQSSEESEYSEEETTLEDLKRNTERALTLNPPMRQLSIRKQHTPHTLISDQF